MMNTRNKLWDRCILKVKDKLEFQWLNKIHYHHPDTHCSLCDTIRGGSANNFLQDWQSNCILILGHWLYEGAVVCVRYTSQPGQWLYYSLPPGNLPQGYQQSALYAPTRQSAHEQSWPLHAWQSEHTVCPVFLFAGEKGNKAMAENNVLALACLAHLWTFLCLWVHPAFRKSTCTHHLYT